jgi:hypothetical protein
MAFEVLEGLQKDQNWPRCLGTMRVSGGPLHTAWPQVGFRNLFVRRLTENADDCELSPLVTTSTGWMKGQRACVEVRVEGIRWHCAKQSGLLTKRKGKCSVGHMTGALGSSTVALAKLSTRT